MSMPFTIKVDNTTAIAFSKGNVRKSKLKHIDVRLDLDTANFDVTATFFDFYVTVSGCGCFPQKVTVRVFGFVVKNGDCRNRCKRNKIPNEQRFQTRDVSDGGRRGTRRNGGSRRLYLQESFMCMHVCTFMKHVRAYLFALIRARARAANACAMPCSMYACARA